VKIFSVRPQKKAVTALYRSFFGYTYTISSEVGRVFLVRKRRNWMLNRGDAVVYKCRGLYKVEDIGTLDFSFADRQKKYYTLQSVEDERDRAYVPTDDESNIRKPVSREEALNLIDRIADIEVLKV